MKAPHLLHSVDTQGREVCLYGPLTLRMDIDWRAVPTRWHPQPRFAFLGIGGVFVECADLRIDVAHDLVWEPVRVSDGTYDVIGATEAYNVGLPELSIHIVLGALADPTLVVELNQIPGVRAELCRCMELVCNARACRCKRCHAPFWMTGP